MYQSLGVSLWYYITMSTKQPKKAVTKSTSKKKQRRVSRPRTVVIGVLAVLTALAAASVLLYLSLTYMHRVEIEQRLERITAIYDSLQLSSDEYIVQQADVFGDKRPYEWDEGRTYSSVVRYVHGDTLENTVTELDAAIKAAGFTFIDEPYPGSIGNVQYHYTSDEGAYVRLTVSSKQRLEAFQNATIMGELDDETIEELNASIDPNAGPVNVTIKVNLDDNNE